MEVSIIGVGQVPSKVRHNGKDFREMLYEAAKKAYADSGLSPSDVGVVVGSGLEFFDGISITDSYTPDQVGGWLKFNTLIANDSLVAFIHACMLIETGLYEVVLVEAHAKPSDILNYEEVLLSSFDPHYLRPLSPHPYVLAGLDASAYLSSAGADTTDLSLVASKNRSNATHNPSAANGATINSEEIEETETLFHPIKEGHVARRCDYAGVVILGSGRIARGHPKPVWVKGVGYVSCSGSSSPELRKWGEAGWSIRAGKIADISAPMKPREIDLVEVSEPFSYMELQILDGLHILDGSAHVHLRSGDLDIDGLLPTNPSGGCIGMGYPLTAAGLQRLIECVLQLRGDAAGRQVRDAKTAVAASPDSEISDAGGVVVLGTEGR